MRIRLLRKLYWPAAMLVAFTASVRADVSVQQKTSLDVAAVIHMHGATTTSFATDKKREDTESHCEGVMSLLCGNVKGGDIVRLDRDVTWHLEPAKKRYREETFATPEEMAAIRAKVQANLEKMRSCPVAPQTQPVDHSKCEMSPPKIEVHKTDDKMSIAGHDAERTAATLTETCANKDTGDVCDTVIAVDVWLTQDSLPGNADRRAFDQAYARKLGLDDASGLMRADVSKFLAAYQSQIKQLTDKSADFKGQPLKTSLRVLMGGRQCSAAARAKSDQGGGDGSSAGDSPLGTVAQAGKELGASVGHMMGGLFHKKKADDSTAAGADSGAQTTAAAAPTTPDPFGQYTQLAAFTMETVSIDTSAVPAERFEIPPGWTREVPKPGKDGDQEFSCPKS